MLRELEGQQLTEWMAFYRLEPFGWFEDEYRAALISSTVANSRLGKIKRVRIKSLMRNFEPRPDKDSLINKLKNVFSSNFKIIDKR